MAVCVLPLIGGTSNRSCRVHLLLLSLVILGLFTLGDGILWNKDKGSDRGSRASSALLERFVSLHGDVGTFNLFFDDGVEVGIDTNGLYMLHTDRTGYGLKSYAPLADAFLVPYNEMLTHVPLLLADKIERVVVFGTGVGGNLREVLKYSEVRHVAAIEYSEAVVTNSRLFYHTSAAAYNDSRVDTFICDAQEWLHREAERAPGSYDVAIIDCCYWSTKDFQAIRKLLRPGGIASWALDWISRLWNSDDQIAREINTINSVFKPSERYAYSRLIPAHQKQVLESWIDLVVGNGPLPSLDKVNWARFALATNTSDSDTLDFTSSTYRMGLRQPMECMTFYETICDEYMAAAWFWLSPQNISRRKQRRYMAPRDGTPGLASVNYPKVGGGQSLRRGLEDATVGLLYDTKTFVWLLGIPAELLGRVVAQYDHDRVQVISIEELGLRRTDSCVDVLDLDKFWGDAATPEENGDERSKLWALGTQGVNDTEDVFDDAFD